MVTQFRSSDEVTFKWLEKYGLIANMAGYWKCETPEAVLTKYRNYPDGNAVNNCFLIRAKTGT